MDHGTAKSRTRRSESFSDRRSASFSWRRCSTRLSASLPVHLVDDIENETVSEAGDIGDRALQSNRHSKQGNLRFSIDHTSENGIASPPLEDSLANPISPVPLLPDETKAPLSVEAMAGPKDGKQGELPKLLDYVSCLIHLAVFGILGVSTRYLLQKLFGPGIVGLTSNGSVLYLDLPSNMVGSFLMGWFGVVFKADISCMSDHLAIGLSTGYLGSVTTFSSWNQKMLDLSAGGDWVFTVLGFLLGLFLAAYSIIIGVETARGFKWLITRKNKSSVGGVRCSSSNRTMDSSRLHLAAMVMLILVLALLWGFSGALLKKQLGSSGTAAQLWLAWIVGPLGVWIRWFLARLNGRGLGRARLFQWLPFGTLIANVSAAGLMAALSTVNKAVNTRTCNTVVSGIQLGFLGCLSTVSTFMAEFNAMRESKYAWRAYVYALITICTSFSLGTLIYSIPVWTKGYNK